MLLSFARELAGDRARIVAENERLAARQSEVLERLETLRAESLEREMAKEKHQQGIEIRERITDALLPLGMTIGQKLMGTDNRVGVIREFCKSFRPEQLPILEGIAGDYWPVLEEQITAALDGRVDVPTFLAAVKRLHPEQLSAMAQQLNPGQAIALKELMNGSAR